MTWELEPGSGSLARQQNGQPEQRTAEDDRLLDHHNEELIAAIRSSRVPTGTMWHASDLEAPSAAPFIE